MKKEEKFHFIIDLVDNLAANDCSVSKDHPESAYNLLHSPHWNPAVLLDFLAKGIPPQIREQRLSRTRCISESGRLAIGTGTRSSDDEWRGFRFGHVDLLLSRHDDETSVEGRTDSSIRALLS